MRLFKQKFIILAAVLVFGAVGSFMMISTRAAGTASFNFSPSSGSYQVNSTISVTVNINSTDAVDSVTAEINYNPAQLDYTGASYSGSAFPTPYFASDNGSMVSITRSVELGQPGVSGSNKFATLSFKVLGSSGTTSLTVGSGSGIASQGDDVWNGSTTGGTYTMTAPPASTPPPSSTPSSNTSNNTSKNNEDSSTTAPTGAQPSAEVVQANAELDDDQPVPVDGYSDETGYLVAIQVVDNNGKPVANTEVILGEQKATTDSDGMASFTGVVAGTYTAKAGGTELQINVASGDPASVQTFAITTQKSNLVLYGTIGLISLAVLLVGVGIFLKFRGGSIGGGPTAFEPAAAGESQTSSPASTGPAPTTLEPSSVIQPTDKEVSG